VVIAEINPHVGIIGNVVFVIVGFMTRKQKRREEMNKIIQITSCGYDRNEYTQSNQTLFALDSDGNIYSISNEDKDWRKFKSPITTNSKEAINE